MFESCRAHHIKVKGQKAKVRSVESGFRRNGVLLRSVEHPRVHVRVEALAYRRHSPGR